MRHGDGPPRRPLAQRHPRHPHLHLPRELHLDALRQLGGASSLDLRLRSRLHVPIHSIMCHRQSCIEPWGQAVFVPIVRIVAPYSAFRSSAESGVHSR